MTIRKNMMWNRKRSNILKYTDICRMKLKMQSLVMWTFVPLNTLVLLITSCTSTDINNDIGRSTKGWMQILLASYKRSRTIPIMSSLKQKIDKWNFTNTFSCCELALSVQRRSSFVKIMQIEGSQTDRRDHHWWLNIKHAKYIGSKTACTRNLNANIKH
jgi:hypothetical protein